MRTLSGLVLSGCILVAAGCPAGCGVGRAAAGRGPAGGGQDTVRRLVLGGQGFDVATVYEDDFGAETGDWVAEGGAAVGVRGGRMYFDAREAKASVATVWCRRAFEGDGVIEYTARVETGEGNTNLNFFIYGANADGSSVLETAGTRTGAYAEYHRLNNYIITYLNCDENEKQDRDAPDPSKLRVRVRFRKDPGFRLLHEAWRDPAIEKGRDYRFAIVMQGPRTRLYVDGEPVFDCEDAEVPWRRGHHGFRTWATHVSVGAFRVSRIVAAGAKGSG